MANIRRSGSGPDERRRDGGAATREKYDGSVMPKHTSKGNYRAQHGNGQDGSNAGAGTSPVAGFVGGVPALQRNNDVRHPGSKVWVRRDRKPHDYLHTGNG